MNLTLDFHKYQNYLRIRKIEEKTFIRCPIRKKDLVLLPEELVRQLVIQFLVHEKKYPIQKIQVEKTILVNNLNKRFDIVVYNQGIHPFMLIECKSHKVNINQSTLDQASRYNLTIEAPYLFVTNGITNLCVALDLVKKEYHYLDHLPDYSPV